MLSLHVLSLHFFFLYFFFIYFLLTLNYFFTVLDVMLQLKKNKTFRYIALESSAWQIYFHAPMKVKINHCVLCSTCSTSPGRTGC